MGISKYFGIENCAQRLGIVQNLCDYCWFFLYDFFSPNCAYSHSSHTAHIHITSDFLTFSGGIEMEHWPEEMD